MTSLAVTFDTKNNCFFSKCCKEQVMIDARVTRHLPIGFGFAPGSSQFQIDRIRIEGYRGVCLKCGLEGCFDNPAAKRRIVTTRPASINRKLKAISLGASS